jgi:hypothetical protein
MFLLPGYPGMAEALAIRTLQRQFISGLTLGSTKG